MPELGAALATIGAMVPISSGKITTAVQYLDISLPSGFDHYILRHTGWRFSAPDNISAALSTDAGTSFFCDGTNFDTYGQLYDQLNLSFANGFSQFRGGSTTDNSLINTGIEDFPSATSGAIYGALTIYPGGTARAPVVDWESFYHGIDNAGGGVGTAMLDCYRIFGFLNHSATSAPTLGRVNTIRLLPYGNGDCPPTSGTTIIAGSYYLFGAPAL